MSVAGMSEYHTQKWQHTYSYNSRQINFGLTFPLFTVSLLRTCMHAHAGYTKCSYT